jgi:hypothetical protein
MEEGEGGGIEGRGGEEGEEKEEGIRRRENNIQGRPRT